MFEKSKASRYFYLDMIGMKTSTRDKEAYKIYSKDKDKDKLDELKAKIVQKIKDDAYSGLKTEKVLWRCPTLDENELEKQVKCLEYCKKDKDLISEIENNLNLDIHLEFESWFNEQYTTGLIPHFTDQDKLIAENKISYFGKDKYNTIMNELLLDNFIKVIDPILTSLPEETVESFLFDIDIDIGQTDILLAIFRNIKENIPYDERKYDLYYVLGSSLGEEIVDIKEKDFNEIKSKVIKYLEDAYKLSKIKIEIPGKDNVSTETVIPPVTTEKNTSSVKNEEILSANETVDIVPEDDDENINGLDEDEDEDEDEE